MPVILSVFCCAAAAVNFIPSAGSAAAVVRSCRRFMSAPPKAHSTGNQRPAVEAADRPSAPIPMSLELKRKGARSHVIPDDRARSGCLRTNLVCASAPARANGTLPQNRPGLILYAVATPQHPLPEQADGSIVLEARRGALAMAITLRYAVIRELRELLKSPGENAAGLLFGRYASDVA